MTHRAHKWQSTSLRDGPCTRSLYPGRLEGLRLSKLASYKLRQKATARQPSLTAPPRMCINAAPPAPPLPRHAAPQMCSVERELPCLSRCPAWVTAPAKADWVRRAVVSGEPPVR